MRNLPPKETTNSREETVSTTMIATTDASCGKKWPKEEKGEDVVMLCIFYEVEILDAVDFEDTPD